MGYAARLGEAPAVVAGSKETGPQRPAVVEPKEFDRPVPKRKAASWMRSTSHVEKNTPVVYALLSRTEEAKLLEAAQTNAQTNILAAPKITLFNGQTATVQDTTQSPFVVGRKRVAGASGNADKFEPRIDVVSEGVNLRLRTVLRGEDNLHLDCELTFSDIRGVETAKIPLGDKQEPFTVQIPEVAVTRLDASLEFSLAKTLLMSGVRRKNADGNSETLLVMLRCSRLDGQDGQALGASADPQAVNVAAPKPQPVAQTPSAASEAVPWPQAADAKPAPGERAPQPMHGVGVNSQAEVTGGLQLDAEKFELSDDPRPRAALTQRVLELGWIAQFPARIAIEETATQFRLQARKARIRFHNKNETLAKATADKATFMAPKGSAADSTTLSWILDGHVEVELKDSGFSATANHVDLKCDELRLSGGVKLKLEDLQCAADAVVVRDQGIQLTGNATLRQVAGGDPLAHLRADRIDIDMSDGRIVGIGEAMLERKSSAGAPILLNGQRVEFNAKGNQVALTRGKASEPPVGQRILTAVYYVTDLVIPEPDVLEVELAPGRGRAKATKPGEAACVDFDYLVERIKANVAPDSWAASNGRFSITPRVTTLSLEISQTEEAHRQIGELLNEIRRSLYLHATLELHAIVVAGNQDSPRPLRSVEWGELTKRPAVLTGNQATTILAFGQFSADVSIAKLPKVTLRSGKGAEVHLPSLAPAEQGKPKQISLQIVPVVSQDRRNVRLNFSVNARNAIDALGKSRSAEVRAGQSLLVDITHELTPRPKPAKRLLLLVKPQIVAPREEEEELLIPDASHP